MIAVSARHRCVVAWCSSPLVSILQCDLVVFVVVFSILGAEFFPPTPSPFFFLPLGVEWGIMAELQGFASHGDGILLRGWRHGHSGNLLNVPGT